MNQKPKPTLAAERSHYDFLVTNAKEQQWAIKYLYDRLNIIDSKTSAILRFNGVVIGFLTVIVFRAKELAEVIDPFWIYLSALSITVFLALAEAISLSIFFLRFDRITGNNDDDRKISFTTYKDNFHSITICREKQFRAALCLTGIGVALFSFSFIGFTGYLLWKSLDG